MFKGRQITAAIFGMGCLAAVGIIAVLGISAYGLGCLAGWW